MTKRKFEPNIKEHVTPVQKSAISNLESVQSDLKIYNNDDSISMWERLVEEHMRDERQHT
jgi:hypothetical protein